MEATQGPRQVSILQYMFNWFIDLMDKLDIDIFILIDRLDIGISD